MRIPIEDMRTDIQEWFAQANSFEDLAEIFYAVKSEVDKQFLFMANCIANQEYEI